MNNFIFKRGVMGAGLLAASVGVGAVSVGACNVDTPPASTGGVVFGDAGVVSNPLMDSGAVSAQPVGASDAATSSGDSGPVVTAKACDRGVAIVMSDYKSTNVGISGLDGVTKSSSFISSSASKPGLSLALSGDVMVPGAAPSSGRVVIIDRYGTDVLTWMDLSSATVLAQLPVGTGFKSNPQDYLEVDATRAFVPRATTNPNPGQQPNDVGGDLLIVDTTTYAITGSIVMPEENPALQPNPGSVTWLGLVGGEVVVGLGRWSADFTQVGDGRIVGVSPATNKVDWQVDLTGLQACGGLAVSPSGKLGAVACTSKLDSTTYKADPTKSDVVVYDLTVTPPKELRRLGAGVKLNAGLAPQVVFASENILLAATYGGNATPGDTFVSLDATTGAATNLAEATTSYSFGGFRCEPGCGDVCMLADAETNKLRRWHFETNGIFTALDDVTVDTVVGLPPRSLGGI